MINRKIEVNLNEIKRVYNLIEELNGFFHQPLNFKDIEKFANEKYKEISEVYYNIIWGWLPEDIKNEIIDK